MSDRFETGVVHQIQLTNAAFEGRNSIYLLGVDDAAAPTTLVDTGIATPDVDAELRDALADFGASFESIDQILLTHWHHDHAGLAGEIQAESDATVYAHEADAPLVAQVPDAVDAIHERQREYLGQWGMPEGKQRELLDFVGTHDGLRGEPADVTPLTDGDTVSVGGLALEAVHLPGHAAGLLAYAFERAADGTEAADGRAGSLRPTSGRPQNDERRPEEAVSKATREREGRREAFVGDAVLPKYTPNVGGADVRVDRPLQQYLDSLERVEALDLDRAWPGHRGPIFAPTERARDIAAHHDERTERVRRVVEEHAPATAWEVSAELFGSLSTIHILHGPGEAYAHLDHLVHEGELRKTGSGYVPA